MKTDVMVKKRILKTFKAISITLVVLLIMFQAGSVLAGQARLGDSPVVFAIASQTLTDALADFQNNSGVNVIYKDKFVQSKTTSGLSGKYLPAAGLKKLLVGTGLTYQVTAENTVVLKENEMVVAQREGKKKKQAEEKKEARRPADIGEITVTAPGKREEDLQKVPASETYFSDIQLEDADIEDTFDLIQFSPNLHMAQNYAEHVVIIRGISSFNTSIYSPAGFYVDGVSYPLHYMHNPDFFNIERIEVLRGPQGTLYGRNTESGIISITTKKPNNILQGKIFGEYGNYNTFRSGANISGPILKDKLYMGISFYSKFSDGFVENKYNDDDEAADVEHKNGRFTLRFTPTDRWDMSLIGDIMDTDDHCGAYRYINGPMKTDPFDVMHDTTDEYSDQDARDLILRAKYTGSSFNLLSITSWLNYDHDFSQDADLWDNPLDKAKSILGYEDEQFSQEILISSPEDSGPFEWLAGAYGFKEDTDTNYNYYVINKPAWWMANQTFMNPVTDIETKGYAAFGQGTYTLFDRLHLTTGVRFDHQDLEGNMTGKYFDFATFSYKDYDCDKDLDYDEWLPKFSVSYDFTNDVMTYVSASKGYLVGGYNYCLSMMNPTEDAFTYGPEYTWNYEAGIKTNWFNNKLRANLAIFYIDIDDKQVSEMNMTTMQASITNAADAHSQGVELEIAARPIKGLDIFAGFGYCEAEFDDFTATEWNDTYTALVQNDYKDNYLPYAPRYTYNLGVQYRHPRGFLGRVDLMGTDKFYGDYANTAEQGAYETVNLRLGYERENLDFILWAKNIFDREYLSYVFPYGSYNGGVDAPPQTFGVTVTYRF